MTTCVNPKCKTPVAVAGDICGPCAVRLEACDCRDCAQCRAVGWVKPPIWKAIFVLVGKVKDTQTVPFCPINLGRNVQFFVWLN